MKQEMTPKRSSSDFWQHRRSPLAFLAASVLFGFAFNLLSMAFDPYSRNWWISVIGLLAVGLIIVLTPLLRRIWPPQRVELIPTLDKARPCRGLVLLVSQGSGIETAEQAIRYHASTLEWVWLVHSDASHPDAQRIAEELSKEIELRADRFKLIHLLNLNFENHPEAVKEAIEEKVFRGLPPGLEESDVIVDITGGRKATTAGAFLAALPRGRRLEVVNPKKTDPRRRGTVADDPIEIIIDYKVGSSASCVGRSRPQAPGWRLQVGRWSLLV